MGASVLLATLVGALVAVFADPAVAQSRSAYPKVSELYEYVEDQVDKAARLAGGRQRPLMKGEIEGALPLARRGGVEPRP